MSRTIEVVLITLATYISLATLCWGPPGPPPDATPVASPETLALTTALIAGYGWWKKRL